MKIYQYNNNKNKTIIWISGKHEDEIVGFVTSHVQSHIIRVVVDDWNNDLSPWPYKNYKGLSQSFIESIKKIIESYDEIYIGGYSMAGMMSLYLSFQFDCIKGVACCSGSLWYDGFVNYVKTHPINHKLMYFSLGSKEKKTRHEDMCRVEDCTKEIYEFCIKTNDCYLNIQPGNHFHQPQCRLVEGFQYLLKQST